MPKTKFKDPWPRMRGVVDAVATSLRGGRFIEETMESLCAQLGASSVWSTLEKRAGGQIHRSRSASLGASPVELAKHVTEVLTQVQDELRAVAGSVPYASEGSFAAIPLWSHPAAEDRSLAGAMYLEFPNDEATHDEVVVFLESVGALLGGAIVQQTLVEEAREDLRIERARDHNEHYLRLEEILAPPSMAATRDELFAAIDSESSILLLGESGTGKTLLATAFARASRREPIVRATLGQADDLNTIASELFGHERGAFSGAVSKRRGLVDYANKGTLILDEVLNLPAHAQQLLLDFTQFGSYRPLGFEGKEPKSAEVRLVSVTNGDIEQAVADDRFREDLYYRLATVPISLPPLRERREDIAEIASQYLNSASTQPIWELDDDAIEALTSSRLEWRGNIRELESVLERAKNRARAESEDTLIGAHHLGLQEGSAGRASESAQGATLPRGIREKWSDFAERKKGLEALEKEIIEEALEACGGVVLRAARELSVSRSGLLSRISTLQIDRNKFKRRQG